MSGGVYTSGEGADFALSSSYPTDGGDADLTPDDGWVSYVNYTGEGGDHVSFGVRCLENTSLTYRSASTQVAPGSTSSTKAVCSKRSVVLGGGVQVSGSAKVTHVTAIRPWDSKDAKKVPEDGWRGNVVNTSSLQVSMTVHAVCRGI